MNQTAKGWGVGNVSFPHSRSKKSNRTTYSLKAGLDSGLWTLDSRLWTLDSGLWTLHSGLWTLDSGLWTLDSGLWTLDSELWTLDSGLWTLDSRSWTFDFGLFLKKKVGKIVRSRIFVLYCSRDRKQNFISEGSE